ncbi:MAG: hypothetical protein Q9M08_07600, partial [Mariprofundus sp.]|nr:hypothetical protein [Mariprofundus sp.]
RAWQKDDSNPSNKKREPAAPFFYAFFLAFFAALFSFGVLAACFLASLLLFCSLPMCSLLMKSGISRIFQLANQATQYAFPCDISN